MVSKDNAMKLKKRKTSIDTVLSLEDHELIEQQAKLHEWIYEEAYEKVFGKFDKHKKSYSDVLNVVKSTLERNIPENMNPLQISKLGSLLVSRYKEDYEDKKTYMSDGIVAHLDMLMYQAISQGHRNFVILEDFPNISFNLYAISVNPFVEKKFNFAIQNTVASFSYLQESTINITVPMKKLSIELSENNSIYLQEGFDPTSDGINHSFHRSTNNKIYFYEDTNYESVYYNHLPKTENLLYLVKKSGETVQLQ